MADYNVPIKIGAVEIRPGDYIVGDSDGVIVVPLPAAEDVLAKAEQVVATENLVRRDILEGIDPLDAFHRHGRF